MTDIGCSDNTSAATESPHDPLVRQSSCRSQSSSGKKKNGKAMKEGEWDEDSVGKRRRRRIQAPARYRAGEYISLLGSGKEKEALEGEEDLDSLDDGTGDEQGGAVEANAKETSSIRKKSRKRARKKREDENDSMQVSNCFDLLNVYNDPRAIEKAFVPAEPDKQRRNGHMPVFAPVAHGTDDNVSAWKMVESKKTGTGEHGTLLKISMPLPPHSADRKLPARGAPPSIAGVGMVASSIDSASAVGEKQKTKIQKKKASASDQRFLLTIPLAEDLEVEFEDDGIKIKYPRFKPEMQRPVVSNISAELHEIRLRRQSDPRFTCWCVGDVVWAKLGNQRWWPAVISDPSLAPPHLKQKLMETKRGDDVELVAFPGAEWTWAWVSSHLRIVSFRDDLFPELHTNMLQQLETLPQSDSKRKTSERENAIIAFDIAQKLFSLHPRNFNLKQHNLENKCIICNLSDLYPSGIQCFSCPFEMCAKCSEYVSPGSLVASRTVHGLIQCRACISVEQYAIQRSIATLKAADKGKLFLRDVTDDMAPKYSSIVSDPMSISTMEKKLKNMEYYFWDDIHEDVKLMVRNALAYNNKDSREAQAAESLYRIALPAEDCYVEKCNQMRRMTYGGILGSIYWNFEEGVHIRRGATMAEVEAALAKRNSNLEDPLSIVYKRTPYARKNFLFESVPETTVPDPVKDVLEPAKKMSDCSGEEEDTRSKVKPPGKKRGRKRKRDLLNEKDEDGETIQEGKRDNVDGNSLLETLLTYSINTRGEKDRPSSGEEREEKTSSDEEMDESEREMADGPDSREPIPLVQALSSPSRTQSSAVRAEPLDTVDDNTVVQSLLSLVEGEESYASAAFDNMDPYILLRKLARERNQQEYRLKVYQENMRMQAKHLKFTRKKLSHMQERVEALERENRLFRQIGYDDPVLARLTAIPIPPNYLEHLHRVKISRRERQKQANDRHVLDSESTEKTTVHLDPYCTEMDMENSENSSSSPTPSTSLPRVAPFDAIAERGILPPVIYSQIIYKPVPTAAEGNETSSSCNQSAAAAKSGGSVEGVV